MFKVATVTAPVLMALASMVPAASPAFGQEGGEAKPQRIRSVTIQKGERCPPSVGNEVVVCSVLGEPYRIPAPLRSQGPIPAANQAWSNRASSMAETSRVAAGLPDTCSPVGTGGQTGCGLMRAREWAAQRRLEKNGTDGD